MESSGGTDGVKANVDRVLPPEAARPGMPSIGSPGAVEKWAAEQDCDTASAGVNAGNESAKGFYVANGLSLDRETYRIRVPKSH